MMRIRRHNRGWTTQQIDAKGNTWTTAYDATTFEIDELGWFWKMANWVK